MSERVRECVRERESPEERVGECGIETSVVGKVAVGTEVEVEVVEDELEAAGFISPKTTVNTYYRRRRDGGGEERGEGRVEVEGQQE